MQQDKHENELGRVLDQVRYELGFSSLNRLWDEAGVTANRATWYKRVDPRSKLRTNEKQIAKLIRGLERNGYVLSRGQKDLLYAAIGVKVFEQEENPHRFIRLAALKDPDRQRLLDARLENFVPGTRQAEIAALLEHIEQLRPTGGYVTLTALAGEGKTTLAAQLIAHHFGRDKTAYHFIPFHPGLDHQVTMLHSLMASLALKHQYLPDGWTHIFHRDTLAGMFANMLAEIAARGESEVIFIDGLDQIIPDPSMGERDLYFLPPHLPPGIVLVIGTRPDDTLKPLKLLTSLHEYKLPRLSRGDFALVLARYEVQLQEEVAEQLYEATQHNALYIVLAAKELARKGEVTPEDIIKRVSHNPENIFSLSIERIKQPKVEWREVIKPILGLLLAAKEPLGAHAIGQILGVADDMLRDGIQRLGGLIDRDGKGRYYLYHLKLQEYLREDRSSDSKEYVISRAEENDRHKQLADWCSGGGKADIVGTVWQDTEDAVEQERRMYARQYYIMHLFEAREWQRLFQVLDAGTYGRAKMQNDPSLHSYIQDLDVGRIAASWEGWAMNEGISYLPALWRYSLLRCALASRADTYTRAAFEALLLLGREQEAVGLAEILTEPEYQVEILLFLSGHLEREPGREQDIIQLLLRCREAAHAMEKRHERVVALCRVAEGLVRVRQRKCASDVLGEAEVAATNIENNVDRARALETLSLTLARVDSWDQAMRVVRTIEVDWVKTNTLSYMGLLCTDEHRWEQAGIIWAEAEAEIDLVEGEEEKAEALFELAMLFIQTKQWERTEALLPKLGHCWQGEHVRLELGLALANEQQWQRGEQCVREIEDNQIRADALSQFGTVLGNTQRQAEASAMLIEAEAIMRELREGQKGDSNAVLETQGEVLIRAQHWEEALAIIGIMGEGNERIWMLKDLGKALIRTQQWDRADDVVQMIAQSEKDGERIDALHRVSMAFAEVGQWDRAEAVVQLIEWERARAEALLDLGKALAGAQQMEHAKICWNEVINLLPPTEDYSERAEIILDLGMLFAKGQQGEQAAKLWAEAIRMASLIEDNQEKSQTLCKIGATLNAAQQSEQAEGVWDEAESAANALDMQEDRDQALWLLSITLAYAQRWERAEGIAHAIAENSNRADALYTLSATLAHAQQEEKAETIWMEWLRIVDSLEKDEAIYKVGKEFVRAGLWERARVMIGLMENTWRKARLQGKLGEALAYEQQWEQAEVVISEMKKGRHRVEALCVLGTAFALAQQQERAESKWAEAEALVNAIEDDWEKKSSMPYLGLALAKAQLWGRAEVAANRLEESRDRVNILCEIREGLDAEGKHEHSLRLLQRSWQQAKTKGFLLRLFPLAHQFIAHDLKIGKAFYEAFSWVDSLLVGIR